MTTTKTEKIETLSAGSGDAREVSSNEFDALCLSLDKVQLKRRLLDAKAVLHLRYRKLFKPGIYKPAEKALYSDSPFGYRLKWQTRRNPDEPEGYDNQQTAIGVVYLEVLPVPTSASKV